MKKNKSCFQGMAAILLAGSLLAGCGGGTEKEEEPSPQAGDENARIKITMFNTAGFRPTVPVLPIDKDPIRQMIEKALNIELDMTVIGDGALDKLNTLVASGQTPDLIHLPARVEAVKYYNQGVTAELDELLKETPKLADAFESWRWEPLRYKGNTIGVPGVESVGGINGWWINNDWLTNLNLKVPETADELLEVMKAFTFNDPDGNGKNDTYGFVAGMLKDGTLTHGWQKIFWMFGVNPHYVDVVDGKIVYHNTEPRMKEALDFINQMIEAKVVDPDWLTITTNLQLDEKMYKGKAGIIIEDWRRLEPEHVQKMQEIGGSVPDWQLIAPPKGPYGDQILDLKVFQNSQWAISKEAAKDPVKAKRVMELLEYLYTDEEAYPYLAYGVKDVTWKEVNGKAEITDKTSYNEKEYDWKYHYAFVRRADDEAYFAFKNPETKNHHALNMQYLRDNNVMPRLVSDPKDTLAADRLKYMNEMMLKFATGKEPLANWDDYVKTLEDKFKLNELLDIYTTQLQEEGILP